MKPERFLLDTHTFIWMATDPDRLPADVRRRLGNRRNERYVSTASTWEIAIKYWLWKLPAAEPMMRNYANTLRRTAVKTIPIEDGHAIYAGAIDWDHRDPFDRMIAAQAVIEGLPLVTADPAFSGATGVATVW